MYRYLRVGLLVMAMGVCPCLGSTSDLATYIDKFEKKLQQIQQAQDREMARLEAQYIKSLERLSVQVRKSGDLDNTTAVTTELLRFRTDKKMPTEPSVLPQISQLQSSYAKAASSIEASAAKKVMLLSAALDKALDTLQRHLVTENKLEEARAVQDERKRIQNSEPIQQARVIHAAGKPTAGPPPSEAADTTEQFMGHYYYLLPVEYTFSTARDLCKELGGHVVAIDNEREYAFISDFIKRKGCSVWLDISDEEREGRWQNWRGMRPFFLKWHPGEPNDNQEGEDAACLVPGKDMIDVPMSVYHRVICEWDIPLRSPPQGPATAGLCEIQRAGRGSVQILKPGAARLSGGFSADFSHVSSDLQGAAYVRVPWQTTPTHRIKVTKTGFLYAVKISTESREGLPWEHLPLSVRSPFHKSGVYRLRVTEGQSLTVSGYEASVIAAAITSE